MTGAQCTGHSTGCGEGHIDLGRCALRRVRCQLARGATSTRCRVPNPRCWTRAACDYRFTGQRLLVVSASTQMPPSSMADCAVFRVGTVITARVESFCHTAELA